MLHLESIAIYERQYLQAIQPEQQKNDHKEALPLLKIDAKIEAGEVLTLMGPSGCGKSTLLNYLTGFLPNHFHAEGEIWLDQHPISNVAPHLRALGILYQESLLFEHLTVAENIGFGLVLPDAPTTKRKTLKEQMILAQLEAVGLADKAGHYPAMLSGGQKVRVALLRTLAAKPKALLLDEPFSKLDAALRDTLREWLFDFVKRYQLPTLLVTHDIADAQAAKGNIITLPNIT